MTLKATRLFLAEREHARIVPTLIHIPKEQVFKTSYERAMMFATEGIQMVQGWIVHPYIKFDEERGQTVIEPYYWNYIEETQQHVSFSPASLRYNVNIVADNWDLYNSKTEWNYVFPPLIHLVNMNGRHCWTARNNSDEIIRIDNLNDKTLTNFLTDLDTNIISSRILNSSGSSITS